jgi:D-glycero-D-manno-heptose 1,7-bisphosphate phosphatase
MGKVVLIDRDGVLNVDLPHGVNALAELRLEPSAAHGVKLLSDAGFIVVVITNQGAIAKGLVSSAEVERINNKIAADIAVQGGKITQFYVCPHRDEDQCACRKPKPGLILAAQKDWHFDPAQTWFVGDAARDVAAARAAGVKPALVRTGKGTHEAVKCPDVPLFADVKEFAEYVVNEKRRT